MTSEQVLLMLFVDQGRTVGYQRLLADIQLDTVQAQLERDAAILERNEELYRKNAISLIDLEIAQLKDAWNRKQLIVAEKNAAAIGAKFSAIAQIARHYAGESVPLESLYAAYRRSWEAGCEKGPDEVVAMRAWAAFAEKSLERAERLHARGDVALSTLLDRKAQLKIAQANYEKRAARLDRCRATLFPSLDDIRATR